jgi:hypothetical protein
MRNRRAHYREAPALLTCPCCGHQGGTRGNGNPAMSLADLAGKTVR